MTERQIEFDQTVGDYFDACDFNDSDLIVVPGTNDHGGETILEWTDFITRRFPEDRRTVVDYPKTIGPLVGGLLAPRYDESKEIAVGRTRESLARTSGRAVLLGYSQGADAVWEAAVQSVDAGEVVPEDLQVILWGHPQRPDGFKDVMSRRHRITSRLFASAFQADMNGSWQIDSRIAVTSVAIAGDPITSFPHLWPHPVRFVSAFTAGYFMIHGGMGYEGAAQLAKLPVARADTVPGTATTYLDAAVTDPRVQAKAYAKQRLRQWRAARTVL